MPFGLGKSEKRAEDEGDTVREEVLEGSDVASDDQGEESAPARSTSFPPAFLGEGATTPPAQPAPDGDAFFVSVTRQDSAETHRLGSPAEAQALLERLLEEGVPQEAISAFSGRKLTLKVSHRPIVKLSGAREE